ncbi:hypothetical protein HG264_02345 [Pseudomonas sp. gcc21]|uniref:hypothetical protein n=1 Tax=Pseudomonas sp. gcc21 TaxID=2726989 RepID=UPI0014528F72|nr:hypothetical protein [Pseudomonas sp. gcc21]QJD57833.1 hypothetical protein HG264_02345 [Pseudomonas sp. gcc21]
MKKSLLLLPLVLLTACNATGSLVKESALSLTEREGRESFTLAGELPANFLIQATAQFNPLNPERCQVYNMGLGHNVTRDTRTQYRTEFQDKPSSFSFDIPLTYHIGLCDMELSGVGLLIRGRYGEESWQHHRSTGGIGIADTRPAGAPEFDSNGIQTLRGVCTWLFQISKLRLELSKVLSCSETDESWELDPDFVKRRSIGVALGRDELPGKTLALDLRVNPREQPAYRNTWIEFAEGWKPCQPKEGGWISCQSPPVFKTFKMNGRECTVYPACTE